jgi:prepilin-type N-terminal cleavage/methylation domain-containing protein
MRRPRKSLGFTLMEVVIALAILAVALFGSISVITYTTRMNLSSRERMIAMRAAEKKIEQMLSCTDLVELYNKFSDQTEGYGWEMVDGLEPVDPAPIGPPPGVLTPYPTGINVRRPILFVRFPLNNTGTAITEVGSGKFMGCYVVDAKGKIVADKTGNGTPLDQDFDGNTQTDNEVLLANLNTLKLLPVTVEVYWKGATGMVTGNSKVGFAGMSTLSYKYTFFKKN